MKVQDILTEMESRAFGDAYVSGISAIYNAADYGNTEHDYSLGFNRLNELLSADQKDALAIM